jgi:LuxR family maltose regulon positive regulatory protein
MNEVAGSSTNAFAGDGGSLGLVPLDQCAPLCTDVLDAGSLRLVRSKLGPPPLAATCIQRPALLARIDAAVRGKLLLLAAPVGSGKTTLLAQWHAHAVSGPSRQAVAWLSLDEGDDDPVRFFSYLVEAVRCAAPGFDACVPGCHAAAQRFPLQQAATAVCEGLARLGHDLVIVLDDFQWVAAPSMVKAVEFLLNRSPQSIHWIVSARHAPALNTGPLRLSDQLATLDAVDLSLCSSLIVQMGQGLCRKPLSTAEADGIRSRTEGWVAGVKLVLLSAAGPQEADGAWHQFTGSHSELAQYFGAALLQDQPEDVREFLVASSIVDRMTGDLCNALLDSTHGQSMLEHLERLQLFIQPMDSHAHWYRYHALFRDFLRGRLRRDPARMQALHERASRWFAEHQLHDEALHHAFAGSNVRWRCELVARCLPTWRQGGEVADVIRWCEKLPRAEVIGHEELCAQYIGGLVLSRRFDEAAAALGEVQARAAAGPVMSPPGRPKGEFLRPEAEGSPMSPARTGLLRMMLAILSDSGGEADPGGCDGIRFEGADRYLGGVLLTLQAYTMLRRQEFDAAWRLAMRARDQLEGVSLHGYGYASAVATLAERARGDVKAAAQRCKQTYARMRGGARHPAWANAAAGLAQVRYEENRLAEAEALCTQVLPLLSVASAAETFSAAYFTLARLKAIGQRPGEAFQLLDYLHSVLESGRQQRFLAELCLEKIRLCLAQDELPLARKVAGEFGLPQLAAAREWQTARPYDETWERLGLAQASLLIHGQAYQEGRAILSVLRESAAAVGYVYRELAVEAALCACLWQAGEADAAFRSLNRGLSLTRGLGFSRGLFDEVPVLGQVMAAAFAQRRLQQPLPAEYLHRLGAIRGSCAADPPVQGRVQKTTLPLEPLTDREIDLVRLLARGLSNQEISAHSQIALSTTKWHLKNVFAKLDVSTRTGAIARARELQLID